MDTTPILQNTPPGAKPPKEYIRTFERDMEILKRGGKPDLKPLSSTGTPVPVAIQTPPDIPFLPPPAPAFKPAVPTPPKPEPSPRPAEAPSVGGKSSPIKTYSDDFLQKFKKTKASTATVLAAEQDAKFGVPQEAPEKPSRGNIIYIIAGIVLLLLGSTGAYIAYTRYLTNVEPIVLSTIGVASVPIFVDDKEKITAETPVAILQAIKQSLTRSLSPNTVRLLYTDFSTTTDNSVFAALQLPAPGALLRNVDASRSMVGVVNSDGTQSPFFVLSVASYGDTFAGMLSWEKTMPKDLSALFPSYAEGFGGQATSTTTIATSTPPLFTVFFHDEVVSNHDVRIYRDSEGRSVLMYGYWNQRTLIIARDPSAFIEIIGRLATARTKN